MENSLTQQAEVLIEQQLTSLGLTDYGFCKLGELTRFLPSRARPLAEQLALKDGWAVVIAIPYYTGEYRERNISAYALADDYHKLIEQLLQPFLDALCRQYPQHGFYLFADASPIPELEAAVRAGLGFRGRNNQLITRRYGSRVFICEILTDLPLKKRSLQQPENCGACHRCIDACPTGALSKDGFCRTLCRSEITQKKGTLNSWEEQQIAAGGLVWGCDVCTDVCPYNAAAQITPLGVFWKNIRPVVDEQSLTELMPVKSYGWRGRQVLERNLRLLRK